MGSPSLSPNGSIVGLSGASSLQGQDRRCSTGADNSAKMAGVPVDIVDDVPNQVPIPKKRFGELRQRLQRKVAAIKEEAGGKWEKAKDNVGSKVTQAKAYISKLRNPESSPARNDNASRNTGTFVVPSRGEGSPGASQSNVKPSDDVETEVGEDALNFTIGPGAPANHFRPTVGGVFSERRGLGIDSSATASTLTSVQYLTAPTSPADTGPNSLVDTGPTSGTNTVTASLQSSISEGADVGNKALSVNSGQSVLDSESLNLALNELAGSDMRSGTPSHQDTSEEERHLKESPEAYSDPGNASKDADTKKHAGYPIEPKVLVNDSSLNQPDCIPAAHLNSAGGPAVIPVTVEEMEMPPGFTSKDLPLRPVVDAHTDCSINLRPAVADGVDDVITQSPEDGTSPPEGEDPPEWCGARLWKRFKNAMSGLGQLIGGLIDKLLALFNCAEPGDDGPSGGGGDQRPPSSVSITNDSHKVNEPVQGKESPQGCPETEKENETGYSADDLRRMASLARKSLNSSNHSSLRQDEFDKPHEASLCFEMAQLDSLDSWVSQMNTSRRSNDSCTSQQTADREKATDVLNSGGSDFQGEAADGHPMRLESLKAEGYESGASGDQAHAGELTLKMNESQDRENTRDLTDEKSARFPGNSPSHSMDRLPTRGHEIEEVCGTQSDTDSGAQLSRTEQFIQQLNNEERVNFSAAISEARAFFKDLITLNNCFEKANQFGVLAKAKYANEHIKPLIIGMNQRAVTIQAHCHKLFKSLKITDKDNKNTIVDMILKSVFRKKDTEKEGGSSKQDGLELDSGTLMFFIGHVESYKKDNNLDDADFVNVKITIQQALGGAMGWAASVVMSGFPVFTLAIDCTYGTLLRVLEGQRISSTLSRK